MDQTVSLKLEPKPASVLTKKSRSEALYQLKRNERSTRIMLIGAVVGVCQRPGFIPS